MSDLEVARLSSTGLAAATPQLLVAKLRKLDRYLMAGSVVGIRAARWTGGDSLDVDGTSVSVAAASSPLAVRELLTQSRERCLVLVTPCSEQELGADVLARFLRQRLATLDRWQDLADLFRAHGIDPRVVNEPGLVDTLLERVPPGGFPTVTSGMLDLDSAWRALLGEILDVSDPGDLASLLDVVRTPTARSSWHTLDADLRRRMLRWLRDRESRAAASIVGTLNIPEDRAIDPVAVGLVCGVVLGETGSADEADPDLVRAAVRLEAFTDGLDRGDVAAGMWADAAAHVARSLRMGAQPVIQASMALLEDLGATNYVDRSPFLPAGYDRRLRRAAAALDAVLDANSASSIDRHIALDDAVVRVSTHSGAQQDENRLHALQMAARLAHRLREPLLAPESFAAAAQHYAADGGWADLAYARIWLAETDEHLATTYRRLVARVAARRQAEDRRFGRLVADWVAAGSGQGVTLLEDVLDDVVVPVAADHPVLLLVLDGMSMAAAAELFPSLAGEGLVEVVVDGEHRLLAVPPFPTVTRVCRASLLTGRLTTGDAAAEKRNFAAHPGLVKVAARNRPPILFHKSDLRGGRGATLDDEVAAALSDRSQQVVGVVLNAVDDHLAKGEQIAVRWQVGSIGPLAGILRVAIAADRVVVITSDHGHVIDQGMQLRRADGGERWRHPDGPPPSDDEVMLSGTRVLHSGGRIVAPWSDGVRYAPRKHGYHGGASPAEVIVPLGVFVAGLGDWEPAPERSPAWWAAPLTDPAVLEQGPASAASIREQVRWSSQAPEGQLFGFESAGPVAVYTTQGRSRWVDALLGCEVYAMQRQRAGRHAPADELVIVVLSALDTRCGTATLAALALDCGMSVVNVGGVLAGLARLVNIDGYPVLVYDEQSVTLDRDLLAEQFGLETR